MEVITLIHKSPTLKKYMISRFKRKIPDEVPQRLSGTWSHAYLEDPTKIQRMEELAQSDYLAQSSRSNIHSQKGKSINIGLSENSLQCQYITWYLPWSWSRWNVHHFWRDFDNLFVCFWRWSSLLSPKMKPHARTRWKIRNKDKVFFPTHTLNNKRALLALLERLSP